MTDRRRGLGKGLGALIPSGPEQDRPSDVFFPGRTVESTEPAPPVPVAQTSVITVDPDAGRRPDSGPNDGFTGNTESSAHPVDGLRPVAGATFAELPLDHIQANPRQPRQVFDQDELAELVASISQLGVLQPVVVRHSGDEHVPYELVMGERRWRACREAGLDTVPSIIRTTADEDMLRDALLENLHRAQLNPLEEAAAYQQLLQDFGCTHSELAERIGRSRPQISNLLRLLKLPPLVQRRVASGVLSAGHARALLGLPDGAAMERMAQRIVAEGLSVRNVEELVLLKDSQEESSPQRGRAQRQSQTEFREVADDLAARLDTRVQVVMGRRRGKITVEFADQDDLSRILAVFEAARQ